MVTSCCRRSGSFIRGLIPDTTQGAFLAASAGLSWALAGIPSAAITFATLGGIFAYTNSKTLPEPKKILQVSPYPFDDDEKEPQLNPIQAFSPTGLPFPLHPATKLEGPIKAPSQINWENNSCFLSSAMWSFFLNETALLRELPVSISKRLVVDDLFSKSIDAILSDDLTDEKRNALLEIAAGVGDRSKPLTKRQLWDIMHHFQILEKGKFPEGVNRGTVKPLLSLLELYMLIDHCQRNQVVDGADINMIRNMARRVNSNFKDIGIGYGDASEVIGILADLVFEGSSLQQNQYRTRTCVGNGYTLSQNPGEAEIRNSHTGIIIGPSGQRDPATGEIQSSVPNWGRFELAVEPGYTIKQLLENHLMPEDTYQANYVTNNGDMAPFTIRETNQLVKPPEVLMVTLKRYADPTAKVFAEEFMELDSRLFRNGQKGRYELYGVSRHLGSFAHYDAHVKRADRSCYYCDDLRGKRDLTNSAALTEAAQTGYVLVYRKI